MQLILFCRATQMPCTAGCGHSRFWDGKRPPPSNNVTISWQMVLLSNGLHKVCCAVKSEQKVLPSVPDPRGFPFCTEQQSCGFYLNEELEAGVRCESPWLCSCSAAWAELSARRPRSAAAAPARHPRSPRGPGEPPRTTCWSGSSSGCARRAGLLV